LVIYFVLFFVEDLLPSLVILVLIKEGVVVFAFRYILRSVTLEGELIKHQAELAALLSGGDAVQTDVEVGAVVGISVLGVGVELAELVSGRVGGALEAISGLKSISLSLALSPVGGLGPVADAAVLIEPESG